MNRDFSMANIITQWCNRINPCSDEDLAVIRYGAELFFENLGKVLILVLIGGLFGKLYKTIMILGVFCSIRSQAGGFHARTGWGCCMYMAVMCTLSLLGSEIINIPLRWISVCYFVSIFLILFLVPQTINKIYFSSKQVNKKKINTLLLTTLYVVVAYTEEQLRGNICFPLFFEIATLIPNSKAYQEIRT